MSVNLYHKYVTEDVYTICEAYHCYVLEYSIYIRTPELSWMVSLSK